MSEEMAILPGRGIRVDSSAPQQQGITIDNHRQHIDELLEVIKGANGMPVLLVTTSDGRLSAIAMNGLQNMVPTNHNVNGSTENKSQDFRAWMLLVASLMATVTFTVGLTPPGGFWSEDKDNHVAGTPVMRDKFPVRYRIFQGSNSFTFFYSLMAIGLLATNKVHNKRGAQRLAAVGVLISLVSLGISYISGTWDSHSRGIIDIVLFLFVLYYMSFHWVMTWKHSRRSGEQPPDTNNS